MVVVLKKFAGKYLTMATIAALLMVLVVPVTPMAGWFGFVRLPLIFYVWALVIVIVFLFTAEAVKRWFHKHMEKKMATATKNKVTIKHMGQELFFRFLFAVQSYLRKFKKTEPGACLTANSNSHCNKALVLSPVMRTKKLKGHKAGAQPTKQWYWA